ncbi:hypothetical protein [Actinoplanes sichuanensis]|uniref:Uncharacterized protein n=1 Tax=Actinoplanes sichuanensis TaxID=512349 RepID=A0ABW4A939_9ACTN|nr:hypothetical protein [Actinoplanes sichuanensis]
MWIMAVGGATGGLVAAADLRGSRPLAPFSFSSSFSVLPFAPSLRSAVLPLLPSSSLSFAASPASSLIDFRSAEFQVGAHPGDHGSGGHGAVWSVCLAVLTGPTVAVLLLFWLLRRLAGGLVDVRSFSIGRVNPRGPPRRGAGLQSAAISVLRI